ncbi:hypothetical protein DV096_08475 [Bradymonadaceae bacterium TMQ3]|uniref:TNFR-Cys domain-containing protein n=1 Tax=Lujinxingia sediminis TaxID=2480984 RepID=A0ABY0CTV0_9DELT|nr:hypothetical protein [Lujinxingia sediminis]RDV38822.1 hypothetical protein DV096_08475 [Bradymonadaceae bacterium TMQ3]RVU44056.1 hypothetical protein EA187_10910 [Lujinxingia sediminis]TXC76406.1 hypothetical protein FRC91_06600 [Bradymonadales bacterium TMQ1]
MRTQLFLPTPHSLVTQAWRAVVLAALTTWLASCAFESSQLAEVRCEKEGEVEGARRCEGGFWVSDPLLDDGGLPDTPDSCTSPSDEELCELARVACGPLTIEDACGVSRSVDCGGCAGAPFEEEVGEAYHCCESGESCLCQDVERFESRCQDGVCEVVSLGIETRTSGCEACEAQCDDPGECTYETECSLTGEQTQVCVGHACVDGACVESDTPFERTQVCDRSTQGESCTPADACSVGSCEAGACASTPVCDGTTASCGCDSCQNCSELDGWYPIGSSSRCCDDTNGAASCTCQEHERRVYRCDGTSCAYSVLESEVRRTGCETCAAAPCGDFAQCQTAQICATEGTRTRSCEVAVCNPDTSLCDVEFEQESEACTVDTDGDECALEAFPGCDEASCEGGVCVSATTCENTDTSCGCESCEDCTERPEQWIEDPTSFEACCDNNSLCECGMEVRHIWICGEAECELSATGETRPVRINCSACSHNCIASAPGPCCSNGGSNNCQ